MFIVLIVVAVMLLGIRRSGRQAQENTAFEEELRAQQAKIDALVTEVARLEGLQREEFARNRDESAREQQATREENTRLLTATREETVKTLRENREELGRQFTQIRESMEGRLSTMQGENAAKLEEMRTTVDEKLTQTVEKRFADSFALISTRLEEVHKGLGEMQALATGVDDLRKVLANVKTRGNLGEYQLGTILEQVLSPEQYVATAQVKPRSQERVEFAVRMPGRDEGQAGVLLPIDSKFPVEEYERLIDAYEGLGEESAEAIAKRLELRLKTFARDIRDKYINPPTTTDFAIMFVPTEGLYAEVLRRPGLVVALQREYRVTVVGPTNLVAFLSSLQMGFRTLAIEKRSSEVWKLLGAVKGEFVKFESLLDRVRGKLDAASREIERAGSKSRNISRKLNKVQELPATEAAAFLSDGTEATSDAADELVWETPDEED
jgi:DNA recombination protein RmuC